MTTAFTFSGIGPRLGKPLARGYSRSPLRHVAAGLSVAALAVALAAFAASTLSGVLDTGPLAGKAAGQARRVGVFTGEYANGVPVYRLPAVTVVASRKAELAPRGAEDQARVSPVAESRSGSITDHSL
jgi:hypothetical protein